MSLVLILSLTANYLYRNLISANNSIRDVKDLGLDDDDPDLQAAKDYHYDSLRKLYGVATPDVSKGEKLVKGFITQIVGSQPKYGMFQNKVLKKRQDLTGRAVISPDPALGIDEMGMPEDMAWKLYAPFVMKTMVQFGHRPLDAEKMIKDKNPQARNILMREMRERPAMINRAPSLHKYNIMALYPKLTQDQVLTLPPLIEGGFNADHDGDAMQVHVPVSDEAVEESKAKLLPSKNLFSGRRKYAHWTPSQEAVIGLYRATKPNQTKVVKTFKNCRRSKEGLSRGKNQSKRFNRSQEFDITYN